MSLRRLLVACLGALVVAASASPVATAQTDPPAPTGVGTTGGSVEVLGVDVGALLSVDVGTDLGFANLDDAVGELEALVSLAAASVESDAVGLEVATPPFVSRSGVGESDDGTGIAPVTLTTPALSLDLTPLSLTSNASTTSAGSLIDTSVDQVDVLGGLVAIDDGSFGLANTATSIGTGSTRALNVEAIDVLNLAALLDGLGLGLEDLSLDQVLALLDGLGLGTQVLDVLALDQALAPDVGVLLPDLVDPEIVLGLLPELDVLDPVVGLLGASTAADASLADLPPADATRSVTVTDVTELDLVVAGLGADLSALQTQLAETNCDVAADLCDLLDALITLIEDELLTILDTLLATLGDASLLSIGGVSAGVVTEATSSPDTSVAEITGEITSLVLLGNELGPIDLLATLDEVGALVETIESEIGGLLGLIDPSLADLIDVTVLERSTSVTQTGDRIVAEGSLTALAVTITPDLDALIGLLTGLDGTLGDLLGQLGIELPVGPLTEVNDLLGQIGGTALPAALEADGAVLALSDGATITLGQVSQRSEFEVLSQVETPGETPSLPRTGGSDRLLLVALAGLGLAILLRRELSQAFSAR